MAALLRPFIVGLLAGMALVVMLDKRRIEAAHTAVGIAANAVQAAEQALEQAHATLKHCVPMRDL